MTLSEQKTSGNYDAPNHDDNKYFDDHMDDAFDENFTDDFMRYIFDKN